MMQTQINVGFNDQAVVNVIRNMIANGYNEHTVLRELLQNADDASAKKAELNIVDDGNPGIWWWNDGVVTEIDLGRLGFLHDQARSQDPDTIGSFGLGKIVLFNWGEGFWVYSEYNPLQIYVSLGKNDEPDVRVPAPSNNNDHKKEGLALWVPFRTSEMVKNANKLLCNTQIDFETIKNALSNLAHRVAVMLPLLKSLKSVTFNVNSKLIWKVELSGKQRSFNLEPKIDKLEPKIDKFDGTLKIESNGTNVERKYYGSQNLLEAVKEEEIQDWPRGPLDQDGRSDPIRRHAHAAVVGIQGIEGVEDTTEIVRAAFLPLGEAPNNSDARLLLLHANAFLDPTREHFLFPEQEGQLTSVRDWGWRLWKEGALPLIPEVLAGLAENDLKNNTDNKKWLSKLRSILDDYFKNDKYPKNANLLELVEKTHRLVAINNKLNAIPVKDKIKNTLIIDISEKNSNIQKIIDIAHFETLTKKIGIDEIEWDQDGLQKLKECCNKVDRKLLDYILKGVKDETRKKILEEIEVNHFVADGTGNIRESRSKLNNLRILNENEAKALAKAFGREIYFLNEDDPIGNYIQANNHGIVNNINILFENNCEINRQWKCREDLGNILATRILENDQDAFHHLRSVLAGRPCVANNQLFQCDVSQYLANIYIKQNNGFLLENDVIEWLNDKFGNHNLRQLGIVVLNRQLIRNWATNQDGINRLKQEILKYEGNKFAEKCWEIIIALHDDAYPDQTFHLPFFPLQNGEMTSLQSNNNDVWVLSDANESWWCPEGIDFPGEPPKFVELWNNQLNRPNTRTWTPQNGIPWVLRNRANHQNTPIWLLRVLGRGAILNHAQQTRDLLRQTGWIPLNNEVLTSPSRILWHLDDHVREYLVNPHVVENTAWAHRGHIDEGILAKLVDQPILCEELWPQRDLNNFSNGFMLLTEANANDLTIPNIFRENHSLILVLKNAPLNGDVWKGMRFLRTISEYQFFQDCAMKLAIRNPSTTEWKTLLDTIANANNITDELKIYCGLEIFKALLDSPGELNPNFFEGMNLPSCDNNWISTSELLDTNSFPNNSRSLNHLFREGLSNHGYNWPVPDNNHLNHLEDVQILENHGQRWVQRGLMTEGLLGFLYYMFDNQEAAQNHLPQVPGIFNVFPQIVDGNGKSLTYTPGLIPISAMDGTPTQIEEETLILEYGDNPNISLLNNAAINNVVSLFYPANNQNGIELIQILTNAQSSELHHIRLILQHGIDREVKRLKRLCYDTGEVWNDYDNLLLQYNSAIFNPAYIGWDHGLKIAEAESNLDRGIVNLIENESSDEFRNALADGMQNLIKNHQYNYKRTLLELYQNAEDAYREAAEINWQNNGDPKIFDVKHDNINHEIWIRHWGRPLNRFAHGETRRPEYQRDLVRMCSLLDSDKGRNDTQNDRVGHFGLGFKSVYCLTREPRIVSGGRRYRIQGAIWCKEGDQDGSAAFGELNPRETRLGLPVKEEIRERVEEVVQNFREMVPGLLMSAKIINKIIIGNDEFTLEPIGQNWPEGDCDSKIVSCQDKVFWLMRDQDRNLTVAIAVEIDAQGLITRLLDLPNGWPTLWHLAPTTEVWSNRLFLNAPFILDGGRLSLAKDNSQNKEYAKKLGVILKKGVITYRERCSDQFLRDLLIKLIHPLRDNGQVAKAFLEGVAPLWTESDVFPVMVQGPRIRVSHEAPLVPLTLDDLGSEDARESAFRWVSQELPNGDGHPKPIRNDDWQKLKDILSENDTRIPFYDAKNPKSLLFPLFWVNALECSTALTRWRSYSQHFQQRDPWGVQEYLRKESKIPCQDGNDRPLFRIFFPTEQGFERPLLSLDIWGNLSHDDQSTLKELRGPNVEVRANPVQAPGPIPLVLDHEEWIVNVAKSWENQGDDKKMQIIQFYTSGVTKDDLNSNDKSCRRRAWFNIMTFSAAFSLGRWTSETNREFVNWLNGVDNLLIEGLLNNEGRPDLESKANKNWMGLLYRQIEQVAEIGNAERDFAFRSLFAVMHRIALHLDHYPRILLAGDGPEPVRLPLILDPNQDHRWDGVGFPPIVPFVPVLGTVGFFVLLRELQRLDVLNNESLEPHGFPPFRRLRKAILQAADGPPSHNHSQQIYNRIKEKSPSDPTFKKVFDIPFLAAIDGKLTLN